MSDAAVYELHALVDSVDALQILIRWGLLWVGVPMVGCLIAIAVIALCLSRRIEIAYWTEFARRRGYGPGERCKLPPAGWYCTRKKGHEGPCAALPDGQ